MDKQRAYIQQLSADTGYSLEDLPEAMNDREGRRERAREIHADGAMMMIYIIVMLINIGIFF